ncbi:MAG: sulfotransferase [Myxococcota bacterium]
MTKSPIFIGGTGRSGTSVVARSLGQLPGVLFRVKENKLISERNGLRDLVEVLSGPSSPKSAHLAVRDFRDWARRLRRKGFQRDLVRRLDVSVGRRVASAIDRALGSDFTIFAVGECFGLTHYDQAINAFVDEIATVVRRPQIIETEGPVEEYFVPRSLTRSFYLEKSRALLERLYAPLLVRAGAQRWCDDTPANALAAPFLFELYPSAVLLHVVRDPRDVVASYCRQKWAPSAPRLCTLQVERFIKSWLQIRDQLPKHQYVEVRLEDLVERPEVEWGAISAAIGTPIEPASLSEIRRESSHLASYRQILTPSEAEYVEVRLGDWMREHGYLSSAAS